MKSSRLFVGIMIGFFGLVALSPSAGADTGRRLSLGIHAGGGAITWMAQSWRAGFEIGVRINSHLAAAADLSFGSLRLENSSSSGSYRALDSQKWTVMPISLSVLYKEPLGGSATAYLGAGIGYHLFTRTIASKTNITGRDQSSSEDVSFNAIAPQVGFGLEFALGSSVSLKGDLKYVFGTILRQETASNLETRQDINFGGAAVTVGVRLYLF